MEWMRCNSCWLKVDKQQAQFHLTQCGHVYCEKCVVKAEQTCIQCGAVNTISLPLKEPLSPQIAHYFTRPTDLLEKVIQAEQFQESQLKLCLKRSDANDSKYQSLKEAYWISAENLKKIYQKYNKLKMSIAVMQKEKSCANPNSSFTPFQYKTPPNQVNISKSQENYMRGYYGHKNPDNPTRNDEGFRVPTVTRVPRSAGYFTASSLSSHSSSCRMTTPNSNFSRY